MDLALISPNYYAKKYVFKPFYKIMRKRLNLPSYKSIAATRALSYVLHAALYGTVFSYVLDDPKKGFAVGAALSVPWAIWGVAGYIREMKKPYNQKDSLPNLENIISE